MKNNQTWIEVQVGNKVYNLLVAETEEEKVEGLNNVEELPENEGMLFDYSDNPLEIAEFTMENCEIPLDIIFINQDGVVISVKKGEPLATEPIIEDSEFVSCVIEVNQNSGIKPGDKTDLFSDEINNESKEDDIEDDDDDDNDAYPDLKINHLVIFGSDGQPQGFLQGNERIFSRKSTKVIIRKAKKAYMTKDDKDYKALGRYIFNEMDAQDHRDPEYVDNQ